MYCVAQPPARWERGRERERGRGETNSQVTVVVVFNSLKNQSQEKNRRGSGNKRKRQGKRERERERGQRRRDQLVLVFFFPWTSSSRLGGQVPGQSEPAKHPVSQLRPFSRPRRSPKVNYLRSGANNTAYRPISCRPSQAAAVAATCVSGMCLSIYLCQAQLDITPRRIPIHTLLHSQSTSGRS